MTARLPQAFEGLFEPRRYKVFYGGRGAAKSQSFATALLLQASAKPLRVLCARETMRSIADSVHKLLGDKIAELGLSSFYTVEKARISGANGSEFIFAGLRHNAAALKSYEAVDICWVEEAQSCSRASLEVLIPTIRKEGSELWFSFNPDLETDAIYEMFVGNPRPDALVVKVNYDDNPWFPAVLREEMEVLKSRSPEAYRHVWLGETISYLENAIYAEELRLCDAENRIRAVPYDATRPVDTFWDLGWGDNTAIWLAQSFPFEFRLIDYIEDSRKPLTYYLKKLQDRPYIYGTDHLPWDGAAQELGSGRSIEELMREAGRRVAIVPKLLVSDGINAARTIFPQCWFDKERCADGLNSLRHYRYGETKVLGVPTREPLHNHASHGSDAFRYFAVGMRRPEQKRPYQTPSKKGSWMS